MPLSRRLSNSSQEAFSEFCIRNQPLSRRYSTSCDAESINSAKRRDSISKDRGQRVLKRRNRSLNVPKRATRSSLRKDKMNPSSPVPKKQRTTRSKSRGSVDKENDKVQMNNFGTPPWKAKKGRDSNFSPRLTRSAKKKKLQNSKQKEGVFLFSPPNQIENARRETMEREKKLQRRNDRIEENRRNGQLLLFSKSLESLSDLPPEDSSTTQQEESSVVTVKQQPIDSPDAGTKISSTNQDENTVSSIFINDSEEARDVEDFSCLTKSINHGEHSKEMINVIKGLEGKFELLDRRLSEFHPQQPVDQSSNQIIAEELEAKRIQIEKLSLKNSKFEEDNKNLCLELTSLKSDISAEREKLISTRAELEEMKSLNESLTVDLVEYKNKNNHLNVELLPKVETELKNSLEELKKRKEIIDKTSLTLREYEAKVEKLTSDKDILSKDIEKEKARCNTKKLEGQKMHEGLQLEIKKKDQMIKEIQQALTSTKNELDNERSRNSKKITELQSALMHLKSELAEKEKAEKQFSEFKDEILTKNKENNAAVRLVEKERDLLNSRLKEVENKLKLVSEEKNDALFRLGTSDEREDELFNRLRESDRIRKELHSRVMVLIGNIRVFVRVRPQLADEIAALNGTSEEQIFNFSSGSRTHDEKSSSKYGCDDPTKNILQVKEPFKDRGGLSQRRKKWSFGFDNVFDPSHSQEDLWEATEPLVQCAIDGFNVTLFAYGQTGSGKTFTMLGDNESPTNQGIIFRSIRKLFDAKARIEELSRGEKAITMTVEMLEVYNEEVRDLLAPKGQETSLKVSSNKAIGSIQQTVHDEADVLKILKKAQERRTVKATSSNATSSRSHFLFTIEYTITSKDGTSQVGKLNVCDLAGSERLAKSGAHLTGGSLLKETKHINLSLSSLSNVIEKLQAGEKNVPFRESKLTSLLQNSLGGNSKTLCIICCNPLQAHFHETLCSLRFAAKINKVDLKSKQNFSA